MKYRFIIPIALAIALGFLTSKMFYSYFENSPIKDKSNSFFIELKDNTDSKSLEKLKAYITVKENGKDYVCVGITTDVNNSKKIKEFYEEKGFEVDIKENYIEDETFYNNLIQYDILLSEVKREEDLISISKVILSSYEDQY